MRIVGIALVPLNSAASTYYVQLNSCLIFY